MTTSPPPISPAPVATQPASAEVIDAAARRTLDLICEHLERRAGGRAAAIKALHDRLADVEANTASAIEHADRLTEDL